MDVTTLTLTALAALAALAPAAGGAAVLFLIRQSRMPAATLYEDIRERLAGATAALERKQQELRDLDRKIAERDRLAAEAAALKELIDRLKTEYAALGPAREEIEEVLRQAAEAAAELAEVAQALEERKKELERTIAEARSLEAAKAALEEAVARLREEKERLEAERAELERVLPTLRAERDAALRTIAEARSLEAAKAALEEAVARLREEIAVLGKAAEEKRAELAGLAADLAAARQTIAEARRLEAEKAALEEAVARLREEKERLEAERRELERVLPTLRAERDAALRTIAEARRLEAARAALEEAVARLREEIADREELAQEVRSLRERLYTLRDEIAAAEARLAELKRKIDQQPPSESGVALEDLRVFPPCLASPAQLRQARPTEAEALRAVADSLQAQGLGFPDRTLRAFHTALKINDHAQMTVLAGVSGTGKSLLPRRYAEAMGLHFLQIAVEPRWDSPQDLLGFYNYVERKYRATDLARLLVRMDAETTEMLKVEGEPRHDRMALVLLDEMNIARVEYYFSEFLSRLEVRPRHAEASDREKRRNAQIPIDVRGAETPVLLHPGHNILFAGTMNDDESTLALSAKVIDRANVLQFPAPKSFPEPHVGGSGPLAEALPFETWRGWVREPADGSTDLTQPKAVIDKLAGIMEAFGRPFGYRLQDAILAYAANYPHAERADLRVPLADQIETRILPKLRGVEIDASGKAFEDLKTLVREDLDDTVLADRIDGLCRRQREGTGLFAWRGLDRGS